jgi:non-ribosomal peptide synthetase component F
MDGGFPEFQLPYDFSGDESNTMGTSYRSVVDNEVMGKIKKLAEDNHTTLFVVLFCAFNWLLSQYSGQDDIVCSIISAGRDHMALQDIVGFFINSIATKTRVDFEESFEEFLSRVDGEIMELFQYQGYPLELVLDELKIPYPEISVSFNMLNMQEESLELELDEFESSHSESKWNVKFALALHAMEYKNGIELQWVYKQSLFEPGTIELINKGYFELLRAITDSVEVEEPRRISHDIKAN